MNMNMNMNTARLFHEHMEDAAMFARAVLRAGFDRRHRATQQARSALLADMRNAALAAAIGFASI